MLYRKSFKLWYGFKKMLPIHCELYFCLGHDNGHSRSLKTDRMFLWIGIEVSFGILGGCHLLFIYVPAADFLMDHTVY